MVKLKITAVNKFGTFDSLMQDLTEEEAESLEGFLEKADKLDYFSMKVAPSWEEQDLVDKTLIIPGSVMKETLLFLTKNK